MDISTRNGNEKCLQNFNQKPEALSVMFLTCIGEEPCWNFIGVFDYPDWEKVRSFPQSSKTYARLLFQIRPTNAFSHILSNSFFTPTFMYTKTQKPEGNREFGTDHGTNISYAFYLKYFLTGTDIAYHVAKCKEKSLTTPGNVMIILLNSFVRVVTLSAINERQHQ
jgi:hypothetical protein